MAKMATRKKTPRTTIKTRDDLEGVFGEYATLVIELDRLTAQMELEIAAVRKKYEDRLAARKEPAEALFAVSIHAPRMGRDGGYCNTFSRNGKGE